MADDYGPIYEGAGQRYDMDPALLRAVVQTESGGNPNAVSSQGAIGPAQLLPQTAANLGVQDPTDPQQAIYGAAKLLDQNMTRYGNVDDAVRAYHGGTDQRRWGNKTQDYHSKVMTAYTGVPIGNPSPPSDDDLLSGIPSADVKPVSDDELLAGIPAAADKPSSATTSTPAAASSSGPVTTPGLLLGSMNLAHGLYAPNPQAGVGLLQGAADLGHTALNAMDAGNRLISGSPVAQAGMNALVPGSGYVATELPAIENYFGINPAQRAAENTAYAVQYGKNPAAMIGRIAGATALTAPVIAAVPEALGALSPAAASGIGMIGNSLRAIPYVGPLAANALTGSAQGAATGALTSGGSNAPAWDQTKTGAEIGAILGPFAPVVQKVGSSIANAFRGTGAPVNKLAAALGRPSGWNGEAAPAVGAAAVPDPVATALMEHGVQPGQLDPHVQANMEAEAAAQTATTGTADPASLARKANMEQLGLSPTQAMVTRDPIQWAAEQEAAKVSGQGAPIMTTFQNNNNILRQHLANVGEQSGGVTANAYDAGESSIGAAQAKIDEMQADISRAYQEVAQTIGDKPVITPARLQSDLGPLSDQTVGAPIVRAITARMGRYGITQNPDTGAWEGQISAANAEELRKFIGQEATNDPNTQRIVRELQQSLDNDTVDSTGSDNFAAARDLARQRFQEIESSKILGAVYSGKAVPDNFLDRYVVGKSATADDLNAFQRSLTTGNSLQIQRGTQAWNDVRQQTADWIASKATNGQPAEGMVSYPQLRKALQTIGPRKLQTLFGEDGANRYQSILSAAHDSSFQPPMAPVNTSNTNNAFFNKLGEKGIDLLHFVPGVKYAAPAISAAKNAVQKGSAARAANAFVSDALSGSAVPANAPIQIPMRENPLLNPIAVGAAANARNYLTQGEQQ